MITTLAIKNYALIEDIRVEFSSGLTSITGETGAGKSILLGALGMVLGNRADSKVVRNPETKCVIEADFFIASYKLKPLFSANDLDYEDHTILRREILPSGKSRAFVNDTPVTLNQLQKLGAQLIDVHSQNDTQTLSTEAYQMEVIDALAGNGPLLTNYQDHLQQYKTLLNELSLLISEKEQAEKELDYHAFLYQELSEAKLDKVHQEELEETYEKLNNTEEIQDGLAAILHLLTQEHTGSATLAGEARNMLAKLSHFSKDYEALWNRLNSTIIELEDISEELQTAADQLEADPIALSTVHSTLQSIYKLQQKHNVATVEELRVIETDLSSKLEASSSIDQRIESLKEALGTAKENTLAVTSQLDVNRKKAIPKLKEKLEFFLKDLGLPNAQFQFELMDVADFRSHGNTTLNLLFTANKGMALGPLQKVASGGEMSRIMLAVKAVLTAYKKLPTLIFDEIDTGVSGEIANKMASIMGEMSRTMQLFSITHLPQIAAKGDHHMKVFKEEDAEITTTQIKKLSTEERVIEIAQMIGGSAVSDSAIAHAKQLLN